jgi:hypothetical protein
MAHHDRTLAQRSRKRGATMRHVTREHEIGCGRQNLEAKPHESLTQLLPLLDHAGPALLKERIVFQRGDGAGLGGPPERIGVEAVLYPGERLGTASPIT